MKKIISLLVVLAMLMAVVPTAFATELGGTVEIEAYSNAEWTAPQDGFVKFTINISGATVAVLNGFTPIAEGADSVTAQVTAGTTYGIYPGYNVTTDSVVTWEYVEGGEDVGGNGPSISNPENNELALGDNNAVLAAGDADGETYTFTATESGELTIALTAFAYDDGFSGMQEVPAMYLGMVFSRNYVFMVNEEQIYDVTATVTVNAGDVVTVQLASPMMRYATELTVNLSLEANQGGTAVEGSAGNPYIIDSLPATITGTLTDVNYFDGLFYQYTATEAGTISCSDNGPIVSATLNGEPVSLPVEVAVGDVLILNPWAMAPGDFAIDVVWGVPEAGEPDGSMENPFVITELPWTYTAEGGYHDIYANYTAAEACTLKITYPEGNYVSGIVSFDKFDEQNYYLVYVDAGEIVSINPWGNAEGTYVVSVYDGQDDDDDNVDQGGDSGETIPVHSGTETVTEEEAVEILFTPDADGILTIDISADPGYRLEVQNAATLDTIGLREESSQAQVLTYNVEAGVEYKITINGFSTTTWDVNAATITYSVTFEAGGGSSAVEDLGESNVALVLGEQDVELLPNAITTLFEFVAPEAGVYTVTIPNDAMAELYSIAWISYQICEGNTLVFTATAAEQSFLIGLTSEFDSMSIKIEKTGAYTPAVQTEYKDYVAKNELEEDFKQPEEVVSVDITVAQTVVKGKDGYYHLGTADGPILMVNLNSEGFTLATLSNAITMRGEVLTDGNGNPWGYDYMAMISEYYEYSRENDYHPLNDDLMVFFKDYGAAQGWYDQNMSGFDAIKAGNFNEESAWMVALVYVEPAADNNQGGNTGNNAQTGDFGVIAAAVALGVSAICGTAVITKKKEN